MFRVANYVFEADSAFILGHLKTINFPFGTNGKLMVLGVPIFKLRKVDRSLWFGLHAIQLLGSLDG